MCHLALCGSLRLTEGKVSVMMRFGHGFGIMGLIMFIGLLAVIAIVVLLVRLATTTSRAPVDRPVPGPGLSSRPEALTILDERLARGEIEPQDYQERRRLLTESREG